MSKAFTKASGAEGDAHDQGASEAAHAHVAGIKNYITPSGLQRLIDERRFLLTRERRAVTAVVAWAASNGDRSENADYQYGKRRLREIDRRIRFLTKRIDAAEVVDPEAPRRGQAATRVFFGATVRYANAAGTERLVSIVGADEVDLDRNHISWLSPLARALMKSGPGDRVVLHAPGTTEQLQILEVRYERIPVEPFTEPPKNFGMRIDHLLVTRPVAERTVWAEIDREARKGKPIPSDHAPLAIDLDQLGHPFDAGWEAAEARIAARVRVKG